MQNPVTLNGRRRLRSTVLALAAVGVVFAATASAALASYTHNYNYSYSELRSGPSSGNFVIANLYNNTTVTMRCYEDTSWAFGNYWSNRWFYVTVGSGAGWITSSYVYAQTSVPRCY